MAQVNKKIKALQKASQAKHQLTVKKVTRVLPLMKAQGLPINFASVAKFAGISKTWLYGQHKLKTEIEQTRLKSGKIQRHIDLRATVSKKETEVLSLKKKNKMLQERLKKLRHQLEVVYGELYKLKCLEKENAE